jgi:DNA-binding CsgD family transcriptional regulator/PAS domain-containing protein
MKPRRRKPLKGINGEAMIDVVGSIYEAALDVAQWQTAMGRIASALDAHRALMFVPEMKSGREFWAAHDIDPGMMAGYAEYYCRRDLWALRGYDSLTNPGSTNMDQMVISEAEFLKSEFWNDFTRPIDVFRAACVTVENSGPSPGTRTYLAVYRPRRSQHFDQDTLAFLRTIQPHVLRSLKLGRLLSSAASERVVLQAMLGAVPTPMFACTADAHVRYANPAAEALLRENDGLRSDGLHLVATDATHTNQLARAIGEAAGTVAPDGARTGQTFQVPQRSTGRSMTVTVVPLPQADGRILSVEHARALVIVHHQKRALELAVARLHDVYTLTAAETKLVASMLDGAALPQVAIRLGIGHSTTRTHLKNIFAKTQTHRQSELLQLVQALAY